MGLSIVFVSGPRRSGKSVVIRMMIDRLFSTQPHYVRVVEMGGDKAPPKMPDTPPPGSGVASARCLLYEPEHIFEVLPEALSDIHGTDRFGTVIIEADSDPTLRCAYPYDHRVFVMPPPTSVSQVFRTASEAAKEFHRMLDDTAAFASEIFGMFEEGGPEDIEPKEERVDLTATQMRGFLHTPLGDELATRMALQPTYHGLVESDVILINTNVPIEGDPAPECIIRIERLLERLRGFSDQRTELFHCNPTNPKDSVCKKLLKALKPMARGGQ
jgi:hypothetical protein